jgi:hypothetical protein
MPPRNGDHRTGSLPTPSQSPATFYLEVEVLTKESFGSLTASSPSHLGRLVQAYEVTYEVRGPEDGPTVNTFEVTGDEYRTEREETASTPWLELASPPGHRCRGGLGVADLRSRDPRSRTNGRPQPHPVRHRSVDADQAHDAIGSPAIYSSVGSSGSFTAMAPADRSDRGSCR